MIHQYMFANWIICSFRHKTNFTAGRMCYFKCSGVNGVYRDSI